MCLEVYTLLIIMFPFFFFFVGLTLKLIVVKLMKSFEVYLEVKGTRLVVIALQ